MRDWHFRNVPLKFGVGDWTLALRTLPLQVCSMRLGELDQPVDSPAPPADPLLPDSRGYYLRALPVAQPLPRLCVVDGWLRYVTLQYTHCFIDLQLGLDAYRAKFSGKTRSTIARKIRKYQEHSGGQTRWQIYDQPQHMAEYHRLAREVSVRTYQERLLDAGLPADPEFVEQVTAAASKGQVRGYILFDAERPVAYLHCPIENGAYIYAYLGYDPDYMRLSVGTVLQWLALEDMFARRDARYFDFTEGQSDHKRLFASHEQLCANVMFLRPTLGNRLLVKLHIACENAASSVGRWAERMGIKARIKAVMRFGFGNLKSG